MQADKSSISKRKTVWFWANDCKYEVILDKVQAIGWKLVDDDKKESKCNVYWIDVSTIHERMKTLQPWQIINHFPGMPNIARKNRMGQNLNRVSKIFPREYNFFPKTWVLPMELGDFRQQFDSQGNSIGNRIFIIKPDAGCQGRGIFLTKTWDTVPQMEAVVAQTYIKRPLLIEGYKFDLRLYVLISSVKPLRMYLFHDGLVRMCTEEYVKPNKQNLSMVCMHLTNYAVNKKNVNFQQPAGADDGGGEGSSKKSLTWFMEWITETYGEAKSTWLWKRFGLLAVRAVLTILPTLSREYEQFFKDFNNIPIKLSALSAASNNSKSEDSSESESEEDGQKADSQEKSEKGEKTEEKAEWRGSRCFEILGLDVMVDSALKPWLIEINHLPSFGTDSPLDMDIKSRLMDEAFSTINARPDDEQAFALYHKVEAARRLTAERTAASMGKKRDKASIEKERREEQERIGRERWSKRRAEMLKAKAAAAEAAKQQASSVLPEAPAPAVVALDKVQAIREKLVEIYTIYCPTKIDKIDKLLHRYQDREEEFIEFVVNKYNVQEEHLKYVPPAPIVENGNIENESTSRTSVPDAVSTVVATEEIPAPILPKSIPTSTSGEEEGEPKENRRRQKSVPAPARDSSQQNKDKNSRYSRSLSPPSQRRPAWKGDAEDDIAFRQEIIAQHIPPEDDAVLLREMSVLPSFTRIFPPLPPQKDASADEQEEESDDEDEEVPAAAASKSNGVKEVKDTKKKEKKSFAPLDEIMFQIFLHDKRQTMRLKCPLPNRSRSLEPEADKSDLPPLSEPFKAGGSNSKQSNRGIPGWRPPPQREKNAPVKQPGPKQAEVADRLSRGYSSLALPQEGQETTKNEKKLVVAAKHKIYNYRPIHIQTYGIAQQLQGIAVQDQDGFERVLVDAMGNVVQSTNAESAYVPQGLPARGLMRGINPAPLRQQIYQFDSSVQGNISMGQTSAKPPFPHSGSSVLSTHR